MYYGIVLDPPAQCTAHFSTSGQFSAAHWQRSTEQHNAVLRLYDAPYSVVFTLTPSARGSATVPVGLLETETSRFEFVILLSAI
jgi:hypothetical protein